MNQLIDAAAAAKPGGSPIDLMIALFLLSIVPLLAVSVTSFTRIVIVLGLLRTSIGSQSLPPNIVIAALAMMLTCVVMAPTFAQIAQSAISPYASHRLSPTQAVTQAALPLRAFMLKQARPADIAAFERMEGGDGAHPEQATFGQLAPAFLIGELRAAFAMGFALALPFAVIDVMVAAVLMSLGMYMVSPNAIALPVKLLLFVIADGWTLVAGALVASYR